MAYFRFSAIAYLIANSRIRPIRSTLLPPSSADTHPRIGNLASSERLPQHRFDLIPVTPAEHQARAILQHHLELAMRTALEKRDRP